MRLAFCALCAVVAFGVAAADTLDPVTVTATRDAVPLEESTLSVARIGDGTLERIAPARAVDLFARVPGAWLTRGSGQEHLVAIRSPLLTGAGACGAFLYAEDGIPIRPAGFCNVNALFELNLLQAGALEVTRGVGSALYGSNALHGTVNVLSLDSPQDATTLALAAGDDRFRRVRVRGGDEDAAWAAYATDAGDFRPVAGFRDARINLSRRGALMGADARWTVAGAYLHQDTAGFVVGHDAYRDARRFENANPGAYRRAAALRTALHLDGDGWTLRGYARWSDMGFLQHFLPGTPTEGNGQTSAGLIASRGDARFAYGVDLELARGWLVEDQAQPITSGPPALQETRPAGRHYDYRVDARLIAPFASWSRDLDTTWTLEAGLRAERLRYRYDNRMSDGNAREDGTPCGFGGCLFERPADRGDAFTALAPKLALRRDLARLGVAYLRLARGFRAPQATELYRLQRGQTVADLQAETLDALELGWRRRTGSLAWDAAAYAMRKRHVIFRDSAGFNVADGATDHGGAELDVRWRAHERLSFGAAGSYARHRYAFSGGAEQGETIVAGRDVDSAPRVLWSVRAEAGPWRRLDAEIEAVHVGAYYLDAVNAHAYPGHTLVNLRAHRALSEGSIALRVDNLLDRRYADRADFAFGNYRYFPGAGRRISLEYSMSL